MPSQEARGWLVPFTFDRYTARQARPQMKLTTTPLQYCPCDNERSVAARTRCYGSNTHHSDRYKGPTKVRGFFHGVLYTSRRPSQCRRRRPWMPPTWTRATRCLPLNRARLHQSPVQARPCGSLPRGGPSLADGLGASDSVVG